MIENFIEFSKQTNTGIIKLNRPKALNALNYEMAVVFLKQLKNWQSDNSIKRILITGEGNAFCAGGDVKNLILSPDNQLKKKFFQKEYTLNNCINEFTKDYLSIWNGIIMGGGAGLSIYGNYRIATEKTRFAMPESAIGFFPDIGASYFLSKLKKGVGLFLGLTGYIINARDVLDLNLATHYYHSKNISKIKKNYIQKGYLKTTDQYPKMESELKKNENFIEDIFQNDLKFIFLKLKTSKSDFGQKIYTHLLKRCPMSLAVSTKLINNAKSKSLSQCLEIEYQLCQHMVYRNDFENGVNAVLVNKTYKPQWNPSKIENINYEEVDKMFEPHVEKLYL